MAERHRTDHEIHHIATDLARWSTEHARRLAYAGPDHDLNLGEPDEEPSSGPLSALREKTAEALGHRPEPGLLLLRDLRDLHIDAARNSLYWEMLAQAAQATKDEDLLSLAAACHPQTLRQLRRPTP